MRVLVIAAALFAGALLSACGSPKPQVTSIADCGSIPADKNLKPLLDCMVKTAETEIDRAGGDTTAAIKRIESQSRQSRIVDSNCHVAMHLVGSRLVNRERITLATLQEHLPQSDATNCAGGLTHGMISVMGVTPGKARQMAISICAKEQTRARQFGCVHGIGHGLRRYLGTPQKANAVCKTLGSKTVASDCAQGVYHDFFLAAPSAESQKELLRPRRGAVTIKELVGPPPGAPRDKSNSIDRLCLDQPEEFLKECWYRLVVGPGVPVPVSSPQDILYACGGLPDKQKQACIAAIATGRTQTEQLVERCAPIAQRSQELGAACMGGIDLLSVGRKESGRLEEVGGFGFWRRQVPQIIKGCQERMPQGEAMDACIKQTAGMSVRIVPVDISKSQALSVCQDLKPDPEALCRSAVSRSLRNTLQFSAGGES